MEDKEQDAGEPAAPGRNDDNAKHLEAQLVALPCSERSLASLVYVRCRAVLRRPSITWTSARSMHALMLLDTSTLFCLTPIQHAPVVGVAVHLLYGCLQSSQQAETPVACSSRAAYDCARGIHPPRKQLES